MSKINVSYMTEQALATIKKNPEGMTVQMRNHKDSALWLPSIAKTDKLYVAKKQKIEDFELKLPESNDCKEVDFENSIKLYENLKDLPMHILTEERFWAWMIFDRYYSVAISSMPVKDKTSTFNDHYVFTKGNQRSLYFNVLARCYFRVAQTVDERLEDKYELTRFVIEKPERFRNLTWRNYASRKEIVLATIKAEKDIIQKYGFENTDLYPYIAKYISRLGGAKFLDVISEEDMYNIVFNHLDQKMKALV